MADVSKSSSFRADGQINKDERWVGVQTRTFTRWCNSHLSDRLIKINDLSCDLQDGYTLCQLLEIISDKRVKHSKGAKLKLQKMENLNSALEFVKREGLKLVNIGAEDIFGNNLKIILGLIWTLILRYQINKGIQEGSPKWLLLEWVKNQVRPYGVVEPKDFKTSWIDGTVMSALADSLEPGTNPKTTWNGDPFHDVDQAMQRSLEAYDIPRLMDAEDMVEAPDELAVMTYVSQFRDWADKQASRTAYLRGVPNPEFSFIEGEGLHNGHADVPAHFTIHARNYQDTPLTVGGHHWKTEVNGPAGSIPVAVVDNGNGTYSGTYTPTEAGQYEVSVRLSPKPDINHADLPDGVEFKHIKNSPAHPVIKPSVSGGHSTAEGPGLEHPYADVPTHFTITARDKRGNQVPEGGAHFDVAISGPSGDSHPAAHDNGDGTYTVNYTPTEHGPHTIGVSQNGTPIQGSPFQVGVKPSVSGAHSTAEGPGLEHPYTDVPTHFTITARDKHGHQVPEGGANFDVAISGPSGESHPAPHDNGDGTYTVNYTPTEHGPHAIAVNQDGTPIQGSPFQVGVKPSVAGGHSTAEGPGLEHPYTDVPTHFTITARDKHGHQVPEGGAQFDVAISGPSGDSHPAPHDNGDGTYTVNYTPTEHGPHTIAVNQDGAPIQNSPFQVGVKPSVSPAHSTAEGPGVTDDANINTKPTDFVIVARDKHGDPVGEGGHKVDVLIDGPKGPVPANVKDNGDGTYNVDYLPTDFGKHNVNATINDQPIEGFPKDVSIKPCVVTNNCTASGPGVEGGKVDKRGPIRITSRNESGDQVADGGFHFDIDVEGPNGKVPAENIVDNGDGTYDTAWTPSHSGEHTVNITANGDHIKGSPFHFTIVPQPSAGNSYVEGKGLTEGFDNATAKFKIFLNDKNNAPIVDGHPQVDIDGPAPVSPHIHNNGDGSYDVEYDPDLPGHYKIDVLNTDDGEGEHVRGSPSTAVIIPGADGEHTPFGIFSFTVHAHDKHGEPKTCGGDDFTVAIRHRAEKAGDEADVSSSGVDNGDGTYTATYQLEGTGRFTVDVKLNGKHIRNSPFVHRLT